MGVATKYPYYLLILIMGTLIIRSILCLFKALAIKNGEIDDKDEKIKWSCKSRRYVFKKSFCSSGKDYKVNDYWLPAIIGFFELIVFPPMMAQSLWKYIGAWIAIKTASSWGGWQKTRTAYNRFLLGNILSLGTSYILGLVFFRP